MLNSRLTLAPLACGSVVIEARYCIDILSFAHVQNSGSKHLHVYPCSSPTTQSMSTTILDAGASCEMFLSVTLRYQLIYQYAYVYFHEGRKKTSLTPVCICIIPLSLLQHSMFNNGRSNTCVTMGTVVGFVDIHRKNFLFCSNVHVANVVDFPGFMFTPPKSEKEMQKDVSTYYTDDYKKNNIPKCILALKTIFKMRFNISLSFARPIITSKSTSFKASLSLYSIIFGLQKYENQVKSRAATTLFIYQVESYRG